MFSKPKTKGFARIRAALAEESAPVETEFRREAEVVRQVRESDMDLELRAPAPHSAATTALSSPNLPTQDNLDDISEDSMMMMDAGPAGAGLGLTGSFKQQALKNSKGKVFWDTFSEASGSASKAPSRVTPPPPLFGLPRGSSSGLSLDDLPMDSPSASSNGTTNPSVPPIPLTTASSSGHDTPQAVASQGSVASGSVQGPPSAADITRRINSKRRRDDDFDPVSFKRRAVSPGMSVHNSPILQSPLQRDTMSWGSRPGSVGGDTVVKPASSSNPPSENGSQAGGGGSGGNTGGTNSNCGRVNGGKGRVGYQGMVDTNDGITKLSIE
jgi:hypothetical protein